MRIEIEDLNKAIHNVINDVIKDEKQDAEKQLDGMRDDLISAIKSSSPVRRRSTSKHYRDGWTYKTETKYGDKITVIYNRSKPRLTHIVEGGTKQRKTKWGRNRGRMPASNHIANAIEKIIRRYK